MHWCVYEMRERWRERERTRKLVKASYFSLRFVRDLWKTVRTARFFASVLNMYYKLGSVYCNLRILEQHSNSYACRELYEE